MEYQYIDMYQEILISSLEEIYQIIQEYKKFYNLPRPGLSAESPELNCFYRGQSNCEWDISPSLLRSKVEEPALLSTFAPKENLSLFGTIAYIQHHHQSTRFIDFTTNPDVAIYFACSDNNDKDGALYIYNYAPHRSEWYTAAILSELTRIQTKDAISVQEFSYEILRYHPEFKERFSAIEDLNGTIMSFLDHGFMVLADKDSYAKNIRLQRQSGCFYVCGVQFSKTLVSSDYWRSQAGKNKFFPHSAVVPEDLKHGHTLRKLLIPQNIKSDVLFALALKGITKDYLLPYM